MTMLNHKAHCTYMHKCSSLLDVAKSSFSISLRFRSPPLKFVTLGNVFAFMCLLSFAKLRLRK